MTEVLRVHKIRKKFDGNTREVLKEITLTVNRNQYVAILGASHSGKSTLTRILAGLDKPTSGEVWVTGINLSDLSDHEIAQFRDLNIGVIHDRLDIFRGTSFTADQAIEQVILRSIQSGQNTPRTSCDWLQFVGYSGEPQTLINRLHCTERQKVAVARVMAGQPKLVLADEPTNYALTNEDSDAILDVLDRFRDQYAGTIILFTQLEREAKRADRIFQLRDGILMEKT